MPKYTDEELGLSTSEQEVPPTFGPRRTYSDEELTTGYVPPEERGILSNEPDDGWISSALKSAGTVGQGIVAGTIGTPGEILNLGNMAGAYLASKIDPSKSYSERYEEFEKSRQKSREEGNYFDVASFFPTYSDVKGVITPYTGEYKPTSGVGRMVQSGTEALGQAMVGRDPTKLKKFVTEGIPAFFGGSVAQAAGEYTENPMLSIVAGLGAGAISNTGVGAARNWMYPELQGERVAGAALRGSAEDAASAVANLGSYDPDDYLPGMPVRSSTISGDPGLINMDAILGRNKELMPPNSKAEVLSRIVSGDPERAKTIIAQSAEDAGTRIKPDVEGSYNLPSNAPRQSSSEAVRDAYNKIEKSVSDQMEAAWKNPLIDKAKVYKNKALDVIDQHIAGLSAARRSMIPKETMDLIEQIRSTPGRDISLTELQDLRSLVLGNGREQFRKGNRFAGGENNALAGKIGEVINDSSNIVFGDTTGAARAAWQKAVDTTRDYYQTFGEGFAKELGKKDPGGYYKLAVDKTLDKALAPNMGTQALEQLQKITNGAVNPAVSDYLVASMTKNGSKIVSPKDIDNWLATGNNQALVNKVPGLANRINSIKNMSATDQIANSIISSADDPKKIVKIFDDHQSTINNVVPPQERAYFKTLEKSARLAAKDIPDNPIEMAKELERVANGNLSDLLFAVGTGKFASMAVGVGTLMATGKYFPGYALSTGLEMALGSLLGIAKLKTDQLGNLSISGGVERALTGKVRENAINLLQQARNDPKLMAALMEKPSPESVKLLLNPMGVVGTGIAAEKGVEESRSGFASGGSVMDFESEANRLVGETDKAREFLNSQTQGILSKPDDHVVAALNAVKNVI